MSDLYRWAEWPDCGHQGCADILRDVVVSQGMVPVVLSNPADRREVLEALGAEWYCTVRGAWKPCGADDFRADSVHAACHWSVPAGGER